MVVVTSGCEEANVQMPLGLWDSFNKQMMFVLEILSESRYQPLRSIRVLSQGTHPPYAWLLHIACPDSFNGCRKLRIFLCPASKIIKGGTNPHPVILHRRSFHVPHLSLSSPSNLHVLQKKSSFRRFVLTANHQLLLSWELYPFPSCRQQVSAGCRHSTVAQDDAALKSCEASSPLQWAWKRYKSWPELKRDDYISGRNYPKTFLKSSART